MFKKKPIDLNSSTNSLLLKKKSSRVSDFLDTYHFLNSKVSVENKFKMVPSLVSVKLKPLIAQTSNSLLKREV